MDNSEKYYWKGKDKKVSELSDKEVIKIYFFKKVGPFLTFITRYFPFSLLWQDRRFHNKFKEVNEMDDLIVETASKKGFWFKFLSFERDSKFLTIIGKFIPEKKGIKEGDLIKYLEKVFASRNIYISKQDTETVKFLIVRCP